MTTLTPILAGNWKMNKAPLEARSFIQAFIAAYSPRHDRSVWFFPPCISLAAVRDAVTARQDLAIGVQNLHWEPAGAFTGEISAPMAAAAGAALALVGHSERRHVFGETDEQVGKKTIAAFAAGLLPIVCVGETLEERKAGRLEAVLGRQLDAVLAVLGEPDATRLVLAYEPVWAIGTGVNATPKDASNAHAWLRARVADRLGDRAAAVPILYGGSVKPDNAAELLAAPDVDGLLVGGASLDPASFARIANTDPH
ncbi:MAG: triose-phosphate isomerase [Longimicrobiales bacterium]